MAGLACITATLAAGTGAGFVLLGPGSLLMVTGAGLIVALHIRQNVRGD